MTDKASNGNGATSMTGLPPELIAKLMAGRTRNAYGPKLEEFIASDEPAINPREVWPLEFKEKDSSALYQGFQTAAKKAELSETVIVKQSDGQVFLLHKERVGALLTEQA